MIHDKLDNWPLYFSSKPWQQAFEFLVGLAPEVEDNPRISIQGDDIYAAIMTYETCAQEQSILETHDKYIDIQMSLINSEVIHWFPRHLLKIKVPYDTKLDRTLYQYPGMTPVRVNNLPSFFTVLFPDDAHMPKLMIEKKPVLVKKVVVKVLKSLVI